MKIVFLLFFLFIIAHIFMAAFLPSSIPQGDFPYREVLWTYFGFPPLTGLANFDGIHYILIAKDGYRQFEQSFFPLFPLLVALGGKLFSHYLLGGLVLSWLCFLGGMVYFKKFLEVMLKDQKQAQWGLVLLLAFPTAFFYQALYPEALFLLVLCASLYYLVKRKYLLASVFAVLVSLTKTQGVLLLIPFLFIMLDLGRLFTRQFSWQLIKHLILDKYRLLPYALSPLYGLLLYSGYLFFAYGDPLYYYHAQAAFGAERAVDKLVFLPQVAYRYLKIFFTAQMSFTYLVAVLEFVLFTLVSVVITLEIVTLLRQKKKDIAQLSLQLYSLAVLILPTLTGTLTSVPRYALISLGFFVALAKIKHTWIKIVIILLFSALHILLFVYFLKGYFIS